MSPYVVPGLKYHEHKLIKSERIINEVCNYYKIPFAELKVRCRERELIKARHMICYLLRKHTQLSLIQIAAMFHQDHTTVINAVRKITGFLSIKDHDVMEAVCKIEERSNV